MLKKMMEVIREEGLRMLEATDILTEEKSGPEDVVTNYDRMVQENLERKLREIMPDAGFLGEEGLKTSSSCQDGSFFIIDPIDGTMNFSRGYQRSCISVALAREGQVVYGVVYDPYHEEMFCAERGKGAWVNGRPIRVSDRTLQQGLVMFGSTPYYREMSEKTFAVAKVLFDHSLDLRRTGSAAIDLCALAAGKAEVFYEVLLSPWDYAAAGLILQEAGGMMEAMEGGPVSLTERSSVLAANRASWDQAAQLVREIML